MNVGLPGTGISYREKIGGSKWASRGRRATGGRGLVTTTAGPVDFDDLELALDDRGNLVLLDPAGVPLPPAAVRRVRSHYDDELRGWLEERAEEINRELEAVLGIHLVTPAPDEEPEFEAQPFTEEKPVPPTPPRIGIFDRLLRSRRERLEADAMEAQRRYEEALADWERRRAAHAAAEQRRREEFEEGRRRDPAVMEAFLTESLSRIEWPRETEVSFEIDVGERTVYLDVDLPEIEDLPREVASVAGRGLRLAIKERSATQQRQDYARHIHAVLFRLTGEVFAALPSIEWIVVSGYSQRVDPATGQVRDEYLLSARIDRGTWSAIDFKALGQVDLFAAFERFELRRKMTKTGVFTAIDPFSPVRSV